METRHTVPVALVVTGSDADPLNGTIDRFRGAAKPVGCNLLRRLPKSSGGDGPGGGPVHT